MAHKPPSAAHITLEIEIMRRSANSITFKLSALATGMLLSGMALAQFRSQTSVALARIRQVENVIYADAGPAPAPAPAQQATPSIKQVAKKVAKSRRA